jgi:programmed cell death 6-interacting protein
MLAFGLKKSPKAVDLVKPVQAKITETMSKEDADACKEPLEELQTFRDTARGVSEGGGKAARDQLVKYWQALETLHSRVPISEENVQIPFTWSDAHNSRKTAKQMNATFERACVMLNYVALLSQEAKSQETGTDGGLKEAYNLLSQAVGILDHVRDNVANGLSEPLTADLSDDGIAFARALLVAQAQMCFYRKALLGGMSKGVLIKLAAGTADAYSLAMGLCDKGALAKAIDRTWKSQLQCWHNWYKAEAEYQASMDDLAQTEIGRQIARLNRANAALGECTKYVSYVPQDQQETLQQLGDQVKIALAEAEKDNDTIYMLPIPSDLEVPAGREMVKPTPFETQVPKDDTGDLMFQNLIPLTVHLNASAYSEKVDALVNEQLETLQDQIEATKGSLVSMNLPASLDALESGDAGLSDSLVDKINKLVQKGGVEQVRKQRAELEGLQASNSDLLITCREKIRSEAEDDASMRSCYGSAWQRQPSATLTAAMETELSKYEEQLSHASSSDEIVAKKLTDHEQAIEDMSSGVGPIQDRLPGGDSAELSPAAVAATVELREYLGQLDHLLTAREPMQEKMKQMKAEEDNAVLKSLMDSAASTEEVYATHLSKYDPIKDEIARNVVRQSEIMEKIAAANSRFTSARPSTGQAEDRERYVARLDKAGDAFVDVEFNLREGVEFYKSVNTVLTQCQERVSQFVFDRAQEKAAEVAQLGSTGMAATISAPSPAPPPQQPPAFAPAVSPRAGGGLQGPPPVPVFNAPPAVPQFTPPPAAAAPLERTSSLQGEIQRLQEQMQQKQQTIDYLRREGIPADELVKELEQTQKELNALSGKAGGGSPRAVVAAPSPAPMAYAPPSPQVQQSPTVPGGNWQPPPAQAPAYNAYAPPGGGAPPSYGAPPPFGAPAAGAAPLGMPPVYNAPSPSPGGAPWAMGVGNPAFVAGTAGVPPAYGQPPPPGYGQPQQPYGR